MNTMLHCLGLTALAGANLILWPWAVMLAVDAWRERRDSGLVKEVARLVAEGKGKDEKIAAQEQEILQLLQMVERQTMCEVSGAQIGGYRQ